MFGEMVRPFGLPLSRQIVYKKSLKAIGPLGAVI